MVEKQLDIEDLYIYSYCPYYYNMKGKPASYTIDEVITSMLSRLLLEKAEGCFTGTRKYRAMHKRIMKYHAIDVPGNTDISLVFKTMAKVVSRMPFEEAMIINGLESFEEVLVPVHIVLQTTRRGKPFFHHVQYYYSNEPPSRLRLHNDIRIVGAAAYVASTYLRSRTDVLWRNELFHVYRSALDFEDIKRQLRCLTADVNNDIIYKRIGKWCSRCFLRGDCAKDKKINHIAG